MTRPLVRLDKSPLFWHICNSSCQISSYLLWRTITFWRYFLSVSFKQRVWLLKVWNKLGSCFMIGKEMKLIFSNIFRFSTWVHNYFTHKNQVPKNLGWFVMNSFCEFFGSSYWSDFFHFHWTCSKTKPTFNSIFCGGVNDLDNMYGHKTRLEGFFCLTRLNSLTLEFLKYGY